MDAGQWHTLSLCCYSYRRWRRRVDGGTRRTVTPLLPAPLTPNNHGPGSSDVKVVGILQWFFAEQRCDERFRKTNQSITTQNQTVSPAAAAGSN